VAKTAISWILVGVFAYIWWWMGHGWDYLNTEGNEWSRAYIMLTLVSLAILVRTPRAAGAGMFDQLGGTLRAFLPKLPWLVLAFVVLRAIAWAHTGLADPVDHFTHAIVAVLVAAITTALWFGAIENGSD
jgi:hypothetical protein